MAAFCKPKARETPRACKYTDPCRGPTPGLLPQKHWWVGTGHGHFSRDLQVLLCTFSFEGHFHLFPSIVFLNCSLLFSQGEGEKASLKGLFPDSFWATPEPKEICCAVFLIKYKGKEVMTHLLSTVGDQKDFLVVAHPVVVDSLFSPLSQERNPLEESSKGESLHSTQSLLSVEGSSVLAQQFLLQLTRITWRT